jgi:glycosyltransferase involved in cell wall biosynthesis
MHLCAVMVVRDEEDLIAANLCYHHAMGFSGFVVIDHRSKDATPAILNKLQQNLPLITIREDDAEFDHERYANVALQAALQEFAPDWVFTLDADEFYCFPTGLKPLLHALEEQGIFYASAKWRNALADQSTLLSGPLTTSRFYEPWPERDWQHEGHLRKSFCRVHDGMAVVVGGHYFRREANHNFFIGKNVAPHLCSAAEAYILHFENREDPSRLMRKWNALAGDLVEPGCPIDAPWNEKVRRLRAYVSDPQGKAAHAIHNAADPVTFWGSRVPRERIREDRTVRDWLRQHKSEHLRAVPRNVRS